MSYPSLLNHCPSVTASPPPESCNHFSEDPEEGTTLPSTGGDPEEGTTLPSTGGDPEEGTTLPSTGGEETTANWRKRGYVRKRVKRPPTTTETQGLNMRELNPIFSQALS